MKRAIYPGSFDPITYGHIDVVERAVKLFDSVILGIATNTTKQGLFSPEERVELATESLKHLPTVEVCSFPGLTIDFADQRNCIAIIRGLRAVSDFDYEFQLAQMNSHLNEQIETVFLVPSDEHFYTSSQLVKAVGRHDISRIARFAPAHVLLALEAKLK